MEEEDKEMRYAADWRSMGCGKTIGGERIDDVILPVEEYAVKVLNRQTWQHGVAPVHLEHGVAPVHLEHGVAPVQLANGVAPVHLEHGAAPVHLEHGVVSCHLERGAAPGQLQSRQILQWIQMRQLQKGMVTGLTFTLLLYSNRRRKYLLVHLGDGCAVGITHEAQVRVLCSPEYKPLPHTTWTTASPDAIQHMRLSRGSLEDLQAICLFSDASLVLTPEGKICHTIKKRILAPAPGPTFIAEHAAYVKISPEPVREFP